MPCVNTGPLRTSCGQPCEEGEHEIEYALGYCGPGDVARYKCQPYKCTSTGDECPAMIETNHAADMPFQLTGDNKDDPVHVINDHLPPQSKQAPLPPSSSSHTVTSHPVTGTDETVRGSDVTASAGLGRFDGTILGTKSSTKRNMLIVGFILVVAFIMTRKR